MGAKISLFGIALFLKALFAFNTTRGDFLEVSFLDVGQGDAVWITTPHKRHILIDGGAGYEVSSLLTGEFPLGGCKIDVMVLTHPHKDHLEGLNRLLDYCSVRRVLYNPIDYDSNLYRTWMEVLSQPKYDNISSPFFQGDTLWIDGVTFYGLWPTEQFLQIAHSNINNTSLSLLLDYGDFEVFLGGDTELEALRQISRVSFPAYVDGRLEVYKLSHHGSSNGLYKPLWRALDPVLTVISVGKDNSFGHPHEEVLQFLADRGALVKRTDVEGTVKIRYNSRQND